MKKRLATLIALILLLSSFWGVSCSKQLSVNEYLQQTTGIVEEYNQATLLEMDSMNDATSITQSGELKKGYTIVEVTEHLYAEELNKYYQDWNTIEPPKEFAEYHQSVGDCFYKLENNSRMISTCAEELLDGKESDTTNLIEALHTREDIAEQWEVCETILKQALLKTRKE